MGLGVGLAQWRPGARESSSLLSPSFWSAAVEMDLEFLRSISRSGERAARLLLALVGVIVGLGGARLVKSRRYFFGHADSVSALRWTPPGAIAYAWTHGLAGQPSSTRSHSQVSVVTRLFLF